MTNEERIKTLKAQRAVLKTKLTKFGNYINDPFNRLKKTEVKLRLERVEPILNDFEDLTNQIDALAGAASDDFDEFEKLYYDTLSKAHDLCHNEQAASVSLTADRVNATSNDAPQFRLPPIELATFDGSFDKWLSFDSQFDSMVHGNSSLSTIQKFYYRKSCLKNEAEEIIGSLELTDANYEVARQLLKVRYDNKRVIIQKHVRALMDLPAIAKESAPELRKFIDTTNTHLRALKSLGQPTEAWDTLLIHAFTAKLDRATHQEWERSVVGTEMPTRKEFTNFLEKRCQILQVTSINMTTKINATTKPNVGKRQAFVAQNADACAICQGNHKIYACETFKGLQIKERLEKIKSSKLCFNCFHPGHVNSNCKWSGCKKCGKKHNTMLHYEAKESDSLRDNKQSSKVESIANTSTSTDPSFNALSCKTYNAVTSSQIVLSTAVVNMKGEGGDYLPARVLLDSGAQSNFITERFAQMLHLPRKRIDVPVETLNQVETRVKCSVEAEIHSRCTGYKETVEFLLLPSICNRLPNEQIDRTGINIAVGKPLADPDFNKPKEIDALIGVELFFHLISIGQEKIPGSAALWQKTKLGWVLAGKIDSTKQTSRPIQCMMSFNTLYKSMNKFWELEELPERKFLSPEEFKVEQFFKTTTTRDSFTGHYTVRLPFNEKIAKLGESRKIAERQFYALERKFMKNPE